VTTDIDEDFMRARAELRTKLDRQDQLRQFLAANGADRQPHGGRLLLDHLLGVQGILQRARSEEVVCTAGLFHSVYGTAIYKPQLVPASRREEVREMIGGRAEEIVWTFGVMPGRPTVWELCLSNSRHEFLGEKFVIEHSTAEQLWLDLLRLECANLLEQKAALHKFPFLMRHAKGLGMLDAEGFCI
jgi:hypothetical protein